MRAPRLRGPRGPCPGRPALTGISRARWSAGGHRLPAPPQAAAQGTGSRPGAPRAGSCGPPPPGWTPAPPATPAPTWPLAPAGGEGRGPGAAPPPSSSAGSRPCGCGALPGVGGCGEPGWWAARAGAGGQGRAGGTGGGWSAVPRAGAPRCHPPALLPVESGRGHVASLYSWGNGGPEGSGLLGPGSLLPPDLGGFLDPPAPSSAWVSAAGLSLGVGGRPGGTSAWVSAAGRAAPSRGEGGERSGSPSRRGLGSGLRSGAPGGPGGPSGCPGCSHLAAPFIPRATPGEHPAPSLLGKGLAIDRKSTRLNSSH